MPLASVTGLVDALRANHLLRAAELEEVSSTLQGRFTEPQALARELLGRRWLTQFQIKRLFQERATELVLGPYVLQDPLGKGGMGQVYKARHRLMNRIVALKVIHPKCLTQPDAVLRFQREIELAAQLAHPNIVTAYDAAQVGDRHFLVMEYVEGIDLHHLVEKAGPLAPGRAGGYIAQAALGLQHAFERGLVHRDVKPSNLLLTARGEVIKILDLGLARADPLAHPSLGSSHLTRLGALVGTPDYIAPEQVLDPRHADIRADIYSLGCTFYFLLAARPPFPGDSVTDKLVRHRQVEPEAIEQIRADVPPALTAVLRQMMAKRPEDRFQTPGEVVRALSGPVAALRPAEGKHTAGPSGEDVGPNRPWAVAAMGGLFVLLLVLLLLVWSLS